MGERSMRKMLGFAFIVGVLLLPGAARAEATAAERSACQQDAFRVCSHAIPDRDRVRSCLRQNIRRISSLCRGALQRGGSRGA
jgi:hypothetical protein